MARRLLGTGTTNSSGVATLSYTGSGLGKIQVVATSGELESDRFEMWDVLKYDFGTYGNHNDSIWSNTTKFSRQTGYTLVNENLDMEDNFVSNIIMSGNKTIELKLSMNPIPSNAGSVIQFRNGSSTVVGNISPAQLGLSSSFADIKIIVMNRVVTAISSATDTPHSFTLSDTYDRISLRCPIGGTVRFKDVKIYNA